MTTEHDDRIRAAAAACADRDHHTHVRAALAEDLAGAEGEVEKLGAALDKEQRDVTRYEKGLWAFLYDVFADREERLTRERREAVEAAERHTEPTALQHEHMASIDRMKRKMGG